MARKPIVPVNDSSAVAERRDIDVITAEIRFYKNQAGEAILEIGRRLNEAKEQLEHGEWLNWLSDKIEFSEATAQRFMRLAKEYPNPSPVTDLGTSKALILLALPPAERETFLEESHVVDGGEKAVPDMSKRELERAVQERAEALKAKAEAEAAEAAAREIADRLTNDIKRANESADAAHAESERIQAEKDKLEAELESIRNGEIVLPEEPGQQTIAAIRTQEAKKAKKDAEEKLKKMIAKAADDKAAAEKKLSDAIAECDRVNQEREQEQAAAAERIEQLQKQLMIESTESVTIFKAHFDNAQSCINSMVGCLKKLKDKPDIRDKLAAALRTLCDKTVQSLPVPESGAPQHVERPYEEAQNE